MAAIMYVLKNTRY